MKYKKYNKFIFTVYSLYLFCYVMQLLSLSVPLMSKYILGPLYRSTLLYIFFYYYINLSVCESVLSVIKNTNG